MARDHLEQQPFSDEAHDESYDPAVPDDWPTPLPKTTGEALDRAKAVGGGEIHYTLLGAGAALVI